MASNYKKTVMAGFLKWFMKFTTPVRYRWLDLHPFWRYVAVSVVVFMLAGPSMGAAYRRWQTEKAMSGALEAISAGRQSEAHRLALAVLEADATREEALKVLVRASAAIGDPERSKVARRFLAIPGMKSEDRLFAWQVVCRDSCAWMVLLTWQTLAPEEKSDPAHVTELLDRMLMEEMHDEADKLLAGLEEPLRIEFRLRRSRLLAARGKDDSYQAFWSDLEDAVKQHPQEISRLLLVLDELPQQLVTPDAAAAVWVHVADAHLKEPPDALRAARLEMAVNPTKADDVFAKALAENLQADPLAAVRFCLWVDRVSEARALLKTLPVDRDPAAFALASLVTEREGRLDAWAILLSDSKADNDLAMLCDRVYLATQEKNITARALAEQAAISAAMLNSDDGALIRLARLAEKRGLEEFSRRVWLEAVGRRSGPLPLASRLEPLVEHLIAAKKENELAQFFSTFSLREIGNPVVQARSNYHSCLAGHISPASLAAASDQFDEQLPGNPHIRFVRAFACLLQSEFDEAAALTEDAVDSDLAQRQAFMAVRGIALAGVKRASEADEWLARVDWDQLLPSEKRLLRELMSKSPVLRVNSVEAMTVEDETSLR
jgi:hypothetical protein